MICPRCGTINDDANGFCLNCALPLNAQPSGGQQSMPSPQLTYAAPPAPIEKGHKTLMIVAVVVIALVIIAAIGAALVLSTAANKAGGGGSIFGKTSITASAARPYSSFDSSYVPDNGNRFVLICLNLSNGLANDIALNPNYFKLLGSDGLLYSYSYKIDYSMANGVSAGSKAPINIGFEIPKTVTAVSIQFSGLYSSYACSVGLSNVWSNTPIVAGGTGISMIPSSACPYTSLETFKQPSSGKQFVMVFLNLTNGLTKDVSLSASYFKLIGSDGLNYSYTWQVPNTMASTVGSNLTVPIMIVFETPTTVTANSIVFSDYYPAHSCNVTLLSVWSSNSIVEQANVALSNASYSVTSSGNPYINPATGNRYISVTVTLTNLKTTTLSVGWFEISASNGLTYDTTYLPNFASPPSGLQAKASATLNLAFEIPLNANPTSLKYQDISDIAYVSF